MPASVPASKIERAEKQRRGPDACPPATQVSAVYSGGLGGASSSEGLPLPRGACAGCWRAAPTGFADAAGQRRAAPIHRPALDLACHVGTMTGQLAYFADDHREAAPLSPVLDQFGARLASLAEIGEPRGACRSYACLRPKAATTRKDLR